MQDIAITQMDTDIAGVTPSNWQAYQEMHRAITGKSDTLSKEFWHNNIYTLEDIEELHYKLLQAADSYKVISKNYNIIVKYLDNLKPTYENFDAFKTKLSINTAPIKTITLTYNFLIRHEQTGNPQNYKLSIDIISSMALQEEMMQESPFFIRIRRFRIFSGKTDIEYVDYTIAQNFLGIIDNWFNSREHTTKSEIIKFCQKYSEHIPFICRNLFTLVYGYVLYSVINHFHLYDTLKDIVLFFIMTLSLGVFLREIAHKAGGLIEDDIDSINNFSSIMLTPGDKNLVKKFEEKNKSYKRKAMINTGLQLFFKILSSGIVTFISKN